MNRNHQPRNNAKHRRMLKDMRKKREQLAVLTRKVDASLTFIERIAYKAACQKNGTQGEGVDR